MNSDELERRHFLHYANSPDDVYMREIYSGLYVSFETKTGIFRIGPEWAIGWPGIQLPHKTYREVAIMVQAMGGDWEWIHA